MKTLVVTGVMTLMASVTFAQTPDPLPPSERVETNLATPIGHGRGRRIPAWVCVIYQMARPAQPDTEPTIFCTCPPA
jgi:hypothetical protein